MQSGDEIPATLRPLLDLAQRWGEPDDGLRGDLLDAAPVAELRSLVEHVEAVGEKTLCDWLSGPAADLPPSENYVRLSALSMAVDQARLRL